MNNEQYVTEPGYIKPLAERMLRAETLLGNGDAAAALTELSAIKASNFQSNRGTTAETRCSPHLLRRHRFRE
jgi:hypothetical protein